jgi:hypothetical protein
LDLELSGMNVVAEEDWLARAPEAGGVRCGKERSPRGVSLGRCLLRGGTRPTKRKESSHASGCNATDDECQLTHHHLTRKEEPWPRPRPMRAEV